MTTNIERAEEEIRRWMPQAPDVWDEYARQAATELDNAGLIMPDLPTDVPANGDNYDDIYTTGRMVYACIGKGYELDYKELWPDEAIEHALMLIAAAKLAEKSTNE